MALLERNLERQYADRGNGQLLALGEVAGLGIK